MSDFTSFENNEFVYILEPQIAIIIFNFKETRLVLAWGPTFKVKKTTMNT